MCSLKDSVVRKELVILGTGQISAGFKNFWLPLISRECGTTHLSESRYREPALLEVVGVYLDFGTEERNRVGDENAASYKT